MNMYFFSLKMAIFSSRFYDTTEKHCQLKFYSHQMISLFASFSILILIMISGCKSSKKDSITKDYKQLHALFIEATSQKEKLKFCSIFLKKAKEEQKEEMIIAGYRMFSVAYTDERVLIYSDSIIALTKENSNLYYPAVAYEKKGDFFYDKRAYKNALDNYLQLALYAKKHAQEEMVSNANYTIGVIKRRTENYNMHIPKSIKIM